MNNNSIIKDEIEALLDDIRRVYNNSGKRASGEFEKSLKATYSDNKAIIEGSPFLAGRRAGMLPPVQAIKKWIEDKGIKPIKDNISTTSLAWAIAKKIAKTGTNKENHLKIYEQVITPQRIDKIIQKISAFNVNLFVDEITAELQLLVKNI